MKAYYTFLKDSFRKYFGTDAETIYPLAPTASNRQYFRMESGSKRCIGCYNPDRAENEAFMYISEHLKQAGVKVPGVLYSRLDQHIYLQEDLGHTTLFERVQKQRDAGKSYLNYYQKVIDQMPDLQVTAARNFDFTRCFPREAFDRQSIQWDLNYFKYYFLKLSGVPFHEQKLENDFETLIGFLLEAPSEFFLFRDFQSRNIMIHEEEIYFIDFQGGRRGALQYDLASLLYEAKSQLKPEERNQLLDYYLKVFSEVAGFDRSNFLKYFPAYVLIRLLQAFGAYGYRGYFERKSFFLQSIPPAMENLRWFLQSSELGIQTPHLLEVLKAMTQMDTSHFLTEGTPGRLTVTVRSFSYRKGIPQDFSGNGGGFVFDCRSLPNPGRMDAFRDKTGMDQEVIDFLEPLDAVQKFLKATFSICSGSVEDYIAREFEHLSISFGCTGGQHRSVFCAERMASYLQENYPVRIVLQHMEQEKGNGQTNVQTQP